MEDPSTNVGLPQTYGQVFEGAGADVISVAAADTDPLSLSAKTRILQTQIRRRTRCTQAALQAEGFAVVYEWRK
jgi:hypothetical protein